MLRFNPSKASTILWIILQNKNIKNQIFSRLKTNPKTIKFLRLFSNIDIQCTSFVIRQFWEGDREIKPNP